MGNFLQIFHMFSTQALWVREKRGECEWDLCGGGSGGGDDDDGIVNRGYGEEEFFVGL